MSAGVAQATIRVTLVGDAGRADLAVPLWVDIASLAHGYAEWCGSDTDPVLVTSAGAELDPAGTVEQVGLQHGDVVVALSPAARPTPDPADPTLRRGPVARVVPVQSAVLLVAALCGLAAAGVLAAHGGSGPARTVCLVILLVCALVTSAPLGASAGVGVRARTAAGPAFGAGAGFVAAYSGAAGGLLLGVAVAALAAAVFAAVGRAFLDSEHDEIVEVWLVVGAALAVLTTALLLLGGTTQALCAVLFGVAVVAARLLPYGVVDVPDQALLDLDRLAVTSWSAREQPRGSRRRRSVVRFDGVTEVVRRGRRLVAAGTIVIAVAVATTGPLLTIGSGRDLEGVSSLVMVGLGGVALSLVARSFRSSLPRMALRVSATWVLAVLGFAVLDEFGPRTDWAAFAGAAVLALLVTLTAVSLGRGWRSVWWARVADVVEGLSIVLVVAAVPLASGFFDVVRGFTS